MSKTIKLNPCRICGKRDIVVEKWKSGGMVYMIKCNNTDCPVPYDGYPMGRDLRKVAEKWNRRNGGQQDTSLTNTISRKLE